MGRRILSELMLLVLLAGVAGWWGCGKDEEPSAPGNHAPIIHSMTAEPDTFVANNSILITVDAEDSDGDPLHYDWGTGVDWLLPVSSEANKLRLSNCCEILEMRTAVIAAIVTDGRGGSARDSIRIWVVPAGAK